MLAKNPPVQIIDQAVCTFEWLYVIYGLGHISQMDYEPIIEILGILPFLS